MGNFQKGMKIAQEAMDQARTTGAVRRDGPVTEHISGHGRRMFSTEPSGLGKRLKK